MFHNEQDLTVLEKILHEKEDSINKVMNYIHLILAVVDILIEGHPSGKVSEEDVMKNLKFANKMLQYAQETLQTIPDP